jgi:LPXTG-site transpeptidase (sortase) family protein
VEHTTKSTALAYDVLVVDKVPTGLTYVPGSLKIASGPSGGVTDDTSAPTLKVSWPVFKIGEKAKITFDAIYKGPGKVINVARVQWASLMIDPKGPQSPYNPTSTERIYNPVNSSALVNPESDGDNEKKPKPVDPIVITPLTLLPVTGFAPQMVTALPARPASLQYTAMNGMWLEIPDLGLSLPIAGVPLASTGWDLTWLSNEAGYLEGTTYPGQVGTTGITGHVYLADGTPGPFINLHRLYWGSQVILHADGYRYTYEVRTNRVVSPSDMTVFNQDGYTWLTLLTCKDYSQSQNAYIYRVAVRAVLMKVQADQ